MDRDASPGGRWQRRSDARPDELVAAALDLFAEKGFAATRTEEIARRAGVTVGTLYRYFPSKEALFVAVVQQTLSRPIADAAQRAAVFRGTTVEHFRVLLRHWWSMSYGSDFARVLKLVIAESANFPEVARTVVDQVVQPGQAICSGLLRAGIESGEFRAIDVEHAARVLAATISFASVYRVSLQPHDPRDLDPEVYIETALSMFLDGLRPATRSE